MAVWVNGDYNFSKIVTGNHDLSERIEYAKVFINTIIAKEDVTRESIKHIINIFDRMINRADNMILDIVVYMCYIHDVCENDPEYSHLRKYFNGYKDFVR